MRRARPVSLAAVVLVLAACAASRDREPRASREPRAVQADSVLDASAQRGDARGRFGVVLHREIGLTGARFVLAVATGCRARPRPTPPRDVVLEPDAESAHCRLHPYRGAVSLSLRRADGRWWNDALVLTADREGTLRMRFAELDDALAQHGAELDEFSALRIGRGGWAGSYDLARLRAVQADLHAQWVEHGRGAPALFAVRHADHPGAAHALELAVEARLARQERDYAAVVRGELGAAAFLDRYVWSPLRHRASELLLERRVAPVVEAP